MLIREILEESVQKFGEVKAVKWLNRKEVLERSYSEMLRNVISIRKGLLAEDFAGKHIALIGTLSLIHIWRESKRVHFLGENIFWLEPPCVVVKHMHCLRIFSGHL